MRRREEVHAPNNRTEAERLADVVFYVEADAVKRGDRPVSIDR